MREDAQLGKPILLVIDDDAQFQTSLARALRSDYQVESASTPAAALSKFSPPPDVVLLDLRLDEGDPNDRRGLDLLETLGQQHPGIPIVMITGYPEVDVAVEAMRRGATDFLQKASLRISEIKARLAHALDHSRLSKRVTQLEEELNLVEPRKLVGSSPAMQAVKRFIEGVARDAHATVLIRGETGTGKELVARAIHGSGRRQSGLFVPVMLNALPPAMLESELFGYEAGAFTDARRRHIGYLEKAHGGVLFLDEIGEIDPATQVKLLRFLEEHEFQRLGSTQSIKIDVQIIAATNAELEERVRDGRFRRDLYFRLKVHEVVLPPLKDRPEDVPPLVEHALQLLRRRGKQVHGISPEAMKILRRFSWPGNIRQLKNVIEAALFQAELYGQGQIEVEALPSDVRTEIDQQIRLTDTPIGQSGFTIHEALARTELHLIEQALKAAHGKKNEAWRLLGYNDRFALSRRVRRILDQYPHLKEEFTQINADFSSRGGSLETPDLRRDRKKP